MKRRSTEGTVATLKIDDLREIIEEVVERKVKEVLESYGFGGEDYGWFYSETWERWEREADEDKKRGEL
jgi:hypothetical protein